MESAVDEKPKKNDKAKDDNSGDTEKSPQTASTEQLPAPFYNAERDAVMAYAKRIYFIGADLVKTGEEDGTEASFELPAPHTPVPLSGGPAAACLGAHEALVWSVRWFARSLLEGKVYPRELGAWFPKKLKTATPTRMVTLSWGL